MTKRDCLYNLIYYVYKEFGNLNNFLKLDFYVPLNIYAIFINSLIRGYKRGCDLYKIVQL